MYLRTGRRYRCVEMIWRALKNTVGEVNAERYSGRDFILMRQYESGNPALFGKRTDLAKEREAAFAITVLLRLSIAVITSSSVCPVGGSKRTSASLLTSIGSQVGSLIVIMSDNLAYTRNPYRNESIQVHWYTQSSGEAEG